MAAVCYLGFSITWFWAIGRLGLWFSIIVSNLVQKCWSTPKLWPQNRNRLWRPSAILDLLHHHIGPPTKSIFGPHRPLKFYANPMYSLKIWRFEIFADLAWNAYSRPQNFGFWGSRWWPITFRGSDPKTTFLGVWIDISSQICKKSKSSYLQNYASD